jgi:hydrogenase nickel incorporation protein HypB
MNLWQEDPMSELMQEPIHAPNTSAGDLSFDIMFDNAQAALHNRALLDGAKLCCINILGGAGVGKTSLLERTVEALQQTLHIGVMNGELLFDLAPEYMHTHNSPVVADLTTERACHLNAALLSDGLQHFEHDGGLARFDLLFTEHVGHLIAPTRLALGEHLRVVLVAVTEDEGRPLRAPLTFHCADCVIITKLDQLPHHPFSLAEFMTNMHAVNPHIPIISLSSETGQGMEAWFDWLHMRMKTIVF